MANYDEMTWVELQGPAVRNIKRMRLHVPRTFAFDVALAWPKSRPSFECTVRTGAQYQRSCTANDVMATVLAVIQVSDSVLGLRA